MQKHLHITENSLYHHDRQDDNTLIRKKTWVFIVLALVIGTIFVAQARASTDEPPVVGLPQETEMRRP